MALVKPERVATSIVQYPNASGREKERFTKVGSRKEKVAEWIPSTCALYAGYAGNYTV